MFERIMIVIITTLWIAMLIAILGLFGWWLVSELAASVLRFIFAVV